MDIFPSFLLSFSFCYYAIKIVMFGTEQNNLCFLIFGQFFIDKRIFNCLIDHKFCIQPYFDCIYVIFNGVYFNLLYILLIKKKKIYCFLLWKIKHLFQLHVFTLRSKMLLCLWWFKMVSLKMYSKYINGLYERAYS